MILGIEGLHMYRTLPIASKDIKGLPEFQSIWREEQKSEYDLKKLVEECEDLECRDHVVIRVSQIKEQLEVVKEKVKNAKVVMATLNGLQGSWNSFMWGMCARRKWLLSENSQEEEDREEKMGATKDQALTIQRRSLNQWGIWRSQLLKKFLSTLAFG